MSTKSGSKAVRGTKGAQADTRRPWIGSYFGNHKKAFLHVVNEQRRKPISAFFTCSVLGIAILLPTLLGVLLLNIHQANLNLEGSAQLTVMLKQNVSEAVGQELTKTLQTRNLVENAHFLHRDKALEDFKRNFKLDRTLDHLKDNPLPHSIIVNLKDSPSISSQAEEMQSELSKMRQVDLVQLDLAWVQRLKAISEFLSLSTLILAFMLGTAVLLILGNTIRLAIENQKDEIAILKLVGGTNAFVCRPFLYLGTFYGLGGGLLAILMCWGVLLVLGQPLEELSASYQSSFSLSGLNIESTLLILMVGTILGWVGANISVRRYIRQIEPS